MILVLGGTHEGLLVGDYLRERGYYVQVSTKTNYGRRLVEERGLIPFPDPLHISEDKMTEVLREKGVQLIIDATHPFATNVTEGATKAANEIGITLIRFERDSVILPDSNYIYRMDDSQNAARKACSLGDKIFVTTGSSQLQVFTDKLTPSQQLFVRVNPSPESVSMCLQLGISLRNIIAMTGPLSYEVNRSLLNFYQPDVLVTKESGHTGGLLEKVEASLDLGIKVVLITKPSYPGICTITSLEQLEECLE